MLPGRHSGAGEVFITSLAPGATSVFSGGIATSAVGAIHVTQSDPLVFANGIGTTPQGEMCIVNGGPIAGYMCGLPVNAAGRLVVVDSGPAPSFDLNFLTGVLDPKLTFTRASIGTYYDAAGLLKTAAVDAPRFDHNPTTFESLGLLMELASTNNLTNSTLVGAVAGSPGTLPTGWQEGGGAAGRARTIALGTTANGIPYIDLHYTGVGTAGSLEIILNPGATADTPSGVRAFSTYLSATNIPDNVNVAWDYFASGSYQDTFVTAMTPGTTPFAKYHASAIAPATGVTSAQKLHFTFWVPDTSVDFSIRIAAPQWEGKYTPTSYIPTSGAEVVRALDSCLMATASFTPLFNAAAGTISCEYMTYVSGVDARSFSISPVGSAANTVDCSNTVGGQVVARKVANSVAVPVGSASALVNQVMAACTAYTATEIALSVNGAAVQTAVAAAWTATPNTLYVGNALGANQLCGWIQDLKYWNTRLTNQQMQGGSEPVLLDGHYVGGVLVGPLGVFTNSVSPPPPPVNTVAPVITGVPQSSNTLTCSTGTWLNAVSISFQWFRNNVPMPGQTGSTWTVTSPYIGDVMSCRVTALNDNGATDAVSNSVTIIP